MFLFRKHLQFLIWHVFFQCIYCINIAFSFICLFPGEFASIESICLTYVLVRHAFLKIKQWHTHKTCVCYFATIATSIPTTGKNLSNCLTREKNLKISWCLESFQIFPNQGYQQKSTPPKFNGKRFWRMIVERRSFPFGSYGKIFRGEWFFRKKKYLYISL